MHHQLLLSPLDFSIFAATARAYERIAKTAKQLKSIYNENERRKRKCAIAQWNDGKLFFAKSAHTNHCQLNNNNKSSINFQPKTILKWNFIRVKWCRSYSRCALCGWLGSEFKNSATPYGDSLGRFTKGGRFTHASRESTVQHHLNVLVSDGMLQFLESRGWRSHSEFTFQFFLHNYWAEPRSLLRSRLPHFNF